MKRFKMGNLAKMVAFFLIATALTCIAAFAANGWQAQSDKPDSGKDQENSSNTNSDENQDGSTQGGEGNPSDTEVIAPTPEYLHYITGTETTMEDYYSRPLCFTVGSSGPIYGISASFMTVEIPTECGETRMLCFMNKSALPGKIGALSPTRDYISDIAGFFGGILFSVGCDDSFEYEHGSQNTVNIDFSKISSYHYTEFNSYAYSNSDLINAAVGNTGTDIHRDEAKTLPYKFLEYGDDFPALSGAASSVVISYKQSNTTGLYYSSELGAYVLYKNGSEVKDLISNKTVNYKNCFVLYADATTYETEGYTETVLNTTKGGKGIYCTDGRYVNIRWSLDENGELLFTNESGEKLTVNRGESYISFVKSSTGDDLTIS